MKLELEGEAVPLSYQEWVLDKIRSFTSMSLVQLTNQAILDRGVSLEKLIGNGKWAFQLRRVS